MSAEQRSKSYRTGTTLSGGESTAHYYMNLDSQQKVEVALLEGQHPPNDEVRKQYLTGKRKSRLTIVGRLQPTIAERDNSLFATEVSEETLVNARLKMQARFGLVAWEPKTLIIEQLEDVINPKVKEHFKNAEEALNNHQPDVCLRLLVKISHLDKEGSAKAEIQMRFLALTELCDFPAAQIIAKQAGFDQGKLAWCCFASGQSLLDCGLFDQALKAFEQASMLEPDRIEHKLKQIESLFRMKRYVECVGVVTDLLRQYRKDRTRATDLFTLRARLYETMGHVQEVLKDVNKALKMDPNHLAATRFLQEFRDKANNTRDEAMVMYAKGRFREAVDRLSVCIQTNPINPDFFFKRGLVYRRLGDYKKAVDDLLESIAKMEMVEASDPSAAHIMADSRRQLILLLNDMSIDCFRRSMFDEAITLLNRAIRFDRNEVAFYVNRGGLSSFYLFISKEGVYCINYYKLLQLYQKRRL